MIVFVPFAIVQQVLRLFRIFLALDHDFNYSLRAHRKYTPMTADKTRIHAFRLMPGDDLKLSILAYVKQCQVQSGWILTTVGSLTQYSLRFANQSQPSFGKGFFEIVALNGTVGAEGLHLHLVLGSEKGEVFGGHLLEGSLIYTTAEIILEEGLGLRFTRQKDATTGWSELFIESI